MKVAATRLETDAQAASSEAGTPSVDSAGPPGPSKEPQTPSVDAARPPGPSKEPQFGGSNDTPIGDAVFEALAGLPSPLANRFHIALRNALPLMRYVDGFYKWRIATLFSGCDVVMHVATYFCTMLGELWGLKIRAVCVCIKPRVTRKSASTF